MLSWLGSFFSSDPVTDVPLSSERSETPEKLAKPKFLRALLDNKADDYQSPEYTDQIQLVSRVTLAILIKQRSNKAFCWLLNNGQFDLTVSISFESDSEPLSLLERAIMYKNSTCCVALILRDLSTVLRVSESLASIITKDDLSLLCKQINNKKNSNAAVRVATGYLRLKREAPSGERLEELESRLEALVAKQLMRDSQLAHEDGDIEAGSLSDETDESGDYVVLKGV